MYTNDRDAYRQTFYDVWQKYIKKLPLDLVETQIAAVMAVHPEYHAILDNPKQEFELEENPFLHMSLHIALSEQIQLDKPTGIKQIYLQLLSKLADEHEVQHQMMTCLAKELWEAQRAGRPPDEANYLAQLSMLGH